MDVKQQRDVGRELVLEVPEQCSRGALEALIISSNCSTSTALV